MKSLRQGTRVPGVKSALPLTGPPSRELHSVPCGQKGNHPKVPPNPGTLDRTQIGQNWEGESGVLGVVSLKPTPGSNCMGQGPGAKVFLPQGGTLGCPASCQGRVRLRAAVCLRSAGSQPPKALVS